jgi:hypothetical protein
VSIPQPFIQELLARTDVVEIVGRYVQLKKTGANFSGLCPFHSEKSPSFTVSPSKQFYHCFGCGKNGNAIGFLMDHTGAGFVEAVHDLAQQYGLQVPEDERSPQERARAARNAKSSHTLTDVLEKAGEAYKQAPEGLAARRRLPQEARAVGPGGARLRPGLRARRLAQRWPACSRTTTIRCWTNPAWSSWARTILRQAQDRPSATTASATASCSRSATSRANASASAAACWAMKSPST